LGVPLFPLQDVQTHYANPQKRVIGVGVSFLPPRDGKWILRDSLDAGIIALVSAKSKLNHYINLIEVQTSKIPFKYTNELDFFEKLKELEITETYANESNQSYIVEDVSAVRAKNYGAYCLKIDMSLTNALVFSDYIKGNVRSKELKCVHPDDNRIVISVRVVESSIGKLDNDGSLMEKLLQDLFYTLIYERM
jgi:hypothetical protein